MARESIAAALRVAVISAAIVCLAVVALLLTATRCLAVEQAAQSVVVFLKTAKVKVTKTVAGKTVTVGSFNGFSEAATAIKTMPAGEYRIVLPSPYVKTVPCDIPAGWSGICTDSIDSRLMIGKQ